jgi:hypothetical protein
LLIQIGDHKERLVFDVTALGHYPIVLGVPWLKRHDPTILWSSHSMTFLSQFCRLHCKVFDPEILALPRHPSLPSPDLSTFAEVSGIRPNDPSSAMVVAKDQLRKLPLKPCQRELKSPNPSPSPRAFERASPSPKERPLLPLSASLVLHLPKPRTTTSLPVPPSPSKPPRSPSSTQRRSSD